MCQVSNITGGWSVILYTSYEGEEITQPLPNHQSYWMEAADDRYQIVLKVVGNMHLGTNQIILADDDELVMRRIGGEIGNYHPMLFCTLNGEEIQYPLHDVRGSTSYRSPISSMKQGYDTVNGHGLSTAIVCQEQSYGSHASVEYHVCEDMNSLFQALDINSAASVGFGPGGKVSAKMDFLKQLSFTEKSISILVHAKNITTSTQAVDCKINPLIKAPQTDLELLEFFKYYGDSFVSGLTLGSEYYAAYTFYSQSTEEKLKLKADLSANGILSFGKVDASLKTSLDQVLKNSSTRISFSQSVSGISNPKMPSQEDMINYAIGFSEIPPNNPTIIEFKTTGYDHVPGMNVREFMKITENVKYICGQQRSHGFEGGLGQSLIRLNELLNQVVQLKDVYEFYGFPSIALETKNTAIQEDIKKIKALIDAFEIDPIANLEKIPLNLPALKMKSPEIDFQVSYSPSFGGSGGGSFADIPDVSSYLMKKTRISDIQLRTGARVDQLVVTYTDGENNKTTHYHGGGGGGFTRNMSLPKGGRIVSIQGKKGQEVDYLSIQASNGQEVDGGGNGGSAFAWTPKENDIVIGFEGRSGARLDQIKVICVKLMPPQ